MHQGRAKAQEAQVDSETKALREDLRRAEGEVAGLREQLHGMGSELATKTTELARHQLDLSRVSSLLDGEADRGISG